MYSNFNKSFERASRFNRWFFRAILAFQCAAAIAMIWLVVLAGIAASKTDWSNGVKPVIEQVWCGKPGCLSAS